LTDRGPTAGQQLANRLLLLLSVTAPFNNTWTLKFKAQVTNVLFATVNKIFSSSSQLLTTAEQSFVVWTVHNDLITARSTVVGSWEELPNIWLTVEKNSLVGWALNFRARMLLKGAVGKCWGKTQVSVTYYRKLTNRLLTVGSLSVDCRLTVA